MAKTKISEFNANPALNTDIDSINIAEGCSPSGINDAIRELMAQLKDWQSGTSNDPYVVGSSGSLTLNQGTANGVAYLNGSKVVTSGSALTFDGTNLTVPAEVYRSSDSSYMRLSGGNPAATGASILMFGSTHATAAGRLVLNTSGTGYMEFDLNSSEQMRLTSTGLGIGTSSPNYSLTSYKVGANANYLQVANGSTGAGSGNGLLLGVDASGNSVINAQGAVNLNITVAGVQRATIDSSGNLGLGVTPSAWSIRALQVGSGYAAWSSGVTNARMFANTYYDGSYRYIGTGRATQYEQDGYHAWYTAPSGTAGNAITFTHAMTLDASGNLGIGTTSPAARLDVSGGSIRVNEDGVGTKILTLRSDYAGLGPAINVTTTDPLLFLTANTERARIDSSGNLLIGTTGTSWTDTVGFYAFYQSAVNATRNGAEAMNLNRLTSDGTILGFRRSGTQVGSVSVTTTATAYNTSSDQRLKENIQNSDSASSLIDSLQVRKFDWKADGSHQRYGFVAQELVTVAPEAVYQPEDTEQMMAVDYSKLVPMLVKEVQSLRQRIATLEAK